jgi:pyrroline-5-carboxylate reductase
MIAACCAVQVAGTSTQTLVASLRASQHCAQMMPNALMHATHRARCRHFHPNAALTLRHRLCASPRIP